MGYDYGSRREDQTNVINQSGLFLKVDFIEGLVVHDMPSDDFMEGWKSHGTLHRQSKKKFEEIIGEISDTCICQAKNQPKL